MTRLPKPGSDNGNWGDILNNYLSQSHKADGTLKDNSVTASTIAPGAVTKATVGLGNVNNTSDASKPISDATQTALDAKLATADLDAQTAAKISDEETATNAALATSYMKRPKTTRFDLVPTPAYMAHRMGGGSAAPESTFAAADISVAAGADALESDSHVLADGSGGMMHDDTTDRTAGVSGNVEDHTAASWVHLDAAATSPWWTGDPQPPPLFDQWLDRYGTRTLLVPTPKDGSEAKALFDQVKARGLVDSVCFVVSDLSTLQYIKTNNGLCGFTFHAKPGTAGVPTVQTVLGYDPDMMTIGFKQTGVTDAIIQDIVATGVPAGAWTVNRRVEHDHLLSLGIKWFVTDQPIYLKRTTAMTKKASWSLGSLGHGLIYHTNDPNSPKGVGLNLAIEDGILKVNGAADKYWLVGEMCPYANWNSNFTIDIDLGWETLPSSGTSALGMVFGCADDRTHRTDYLSSTSPGILARIRKDGQMQLFEYLDSNNTYNQLGSNRATAALTEGLMAHLKIEVTPTQITMTRTDSGGFTPLVVANSTRHGGYMHVGQMNPSSGQRAMFGALSIS